MEKRYKKRPFPINNELLTQFLTLTEKCDLEKLIQIIPHELMSALKTEAKTKSIDLDMEVSLRLMATFIYPEVFGCKQSLEQLIFDMQFDSRELRKQNNLRRQSWLYLFEVEKLQLWVEFEEKLPKNFKEKFTLLNVKKEISALRAAKKQRDQEAHTRDTER